MMKWDSFLVGSCFVFRTLGAPLANAQQAILSNNFGIPGQNATFDYVVVGGGTAGLAIAYRLAEDGSKTVAVVEAGGFYEVENGNTSVVPAYNQNYDFFLPDSQWDAPLVDWGFLTTAQAGAQGQKFHYGRGKMLGGCSAQNGMNYNRPTVGTLQTWANMVNDSSYLWDEFLPYFQRSVNYTNPDTTIRAKNATVPYLSTTNETGGPLQLSFPNYASPLSSWAQLAFRELGIEDVHDLINGKIIGSQYNCLTINPADQSRSSSQTSYLDRALNSGRTNLQVYTHTLAKQIIFDAQKAARGVLVSSGPSPQPYILTAREEVILSAGAFQSPQLLMVSGIGPSQTLQTHNIPIIADLPGVGQGMWDHAVVTVGYQVNVETYGRLMNTTFAQQSESSYNTNHTGILTNDQSDYLAFQHLPASFLANLSSSTRTALSQFPPDWPELEYEVSSGPFGAPSFSTPSHPIDVGYIQPVLIAPLSRGNVSITSADMSDPPLINPNHLTHPADKEIAIAALKRGRQFFSTEAMKPVLIGEELTPGLQGLKGDATDDEILEYLQGNIGFNWHASCTCKMGVRTDPMAVVDSNARVIGVEGLRVVDASAFPLLPPGHPQATVYALAEKIAADILAGR